MKYQIQYSYSTGDSFGNEDRTSILELSWNNLDVAKKNLKAIKEHYKMYKEIESLNSWSNKSGNTNQDVLEKYKDNWWFVNKRDKLFVKNRPNNTYDGGWTIIDESQKDNPSFKGMEMKYEFDVTMCQNCMYLKTDNGKLMQQWNPWCGYFESLYDAKIINVDSDLKFEL